MNGKLLLFGFEDLPSILAVEAAAGPFGAETVPVGRSDYGRSLAVLAGLEDGEFPAPAYTGGPLGGRMIVLCGLEEKVGALLPALAQAGAGAACLKAVLTAHNRAWDPVRLFGELQRERLAIGRQTGGT